ncbi:MAG: DUF721 domain-containing protein [Bacteroidia bacterium]|nr:DUF721 domain-containing protein [Bacteroidia bacterium]
MAFSGNEVTLKGAIEEMLREYGLEEKIRELHIKNAWEKMMGKTIYVRTEQIRLKNRKLYIKVNSSVLKEELHFSRGKVLEIINKEFESPIVDEVVIT